MSLLLLLLSCVLLLLRVVLENGTVESPIGQSVVSLQPSSARIGGHQQTNTTQQRYEVTIIITVLRYRPAIQTSNRA